MPAVALLNAVVRAGSFVSSFRAVMLVAAEPAVGSAVCAASTIPGQVDSRR
jgi:hypothetical protein